MPKTYNEAFNTDGPKHWPTTSILLWEHWNRRIDNLHLNYGHLKIGERAIILSAMQSARSGTGFHAGFYTYDFMKSQHYRPNLHPETKW